MCGSQRLPGSAGSSARALRWLALGAWGKGAALGTAEGPPIGEYEDLRAENQKTKEKCDKIRQERDEAVKKLEEFQKISHMVIEEVNFMQNHLEIEKTCRESAEALATKLNKENKALKRISMLYMAKLGPDVITDEINIDDEDSATDTERATETCVSVQCQEQIKELRDQIVSAQEEKKTLAIELEDLKSKLVEVIEEVNKVKQEKAALNSEVLEQRKVLEKCNRVSMLAIEEYEEMQVNLELEKGLRKKAESFAQEMFIEQNKLKRQSHLLLQSSAPDQQLLKALDENAKLTQLLEEERIQHQQKIKELEEQLENETLHKEIHNLKQQLELLEEDKKELELKYQNSEEKARNLKHSVDELQKRVNQSENSVPPPPPPPPPLPPPPPNPIRSLMSMIRKRSHSSGSGAKKEKAAQPETTEEVTDLKRQAVEEMMDRIKKGVHLRPVNQTARPKAKPESSKGSESAVNELKGILMESAGVYGFCGCKARNKLKCDSRWEITASETAPSSAYSSPARSLGDTGITPLSPSHIVNDADPNVSEQQTFLVVVAVDFGTTSSGYAYSFTKEPECIHVMRRWEGGDPGVSNQKTPTTILLTPERKFHSFGYAARDFYHDLDPNEAKQWLYLEKFKMKLHITGDLTVDTDLTAANGKKVKALDIFAYALQYFKEQALKELSDQAGSEFENSDVRWVITVPAIWKQPAKQFMRQAAYQAGLATPENSEQLIIALEPEAASIYCRKLRLHQMIELSSKAAVNGYSGSDTVGAGFAQGDKYVVVDSGGGTVDLTVHQIRLPEGHLKELYKATGGPYGSLGVDYEFEKLLCKIFGEDFIEQFKIKRPAAWVDLMIAFESRKRAAAPDRTNPLNITLPFSFIDYYKKFRGHSVEHALRKSNVDFVKWSSQGMLRMSPDAMNALFKPTIDSIVEHLRDLFQKPEVSTVKFLFLVGGFAEAPLLQQAVQAAFGDQCRIIIPQDVGLTILKGAVLFGLDPAVIKVRRSPLTYGVGVLNRYVEGKHPPEKLLVKDGTRWCTDVFDKFISADQSVALGELVKRSYTPAKPSQLVIVINIYSSEHDNVSFITDPGVKKCGTLRLDLTGAGGTAVPARREIQTLMQFGDTEIKATAIDIATSKSVKVGIDFLNY
ncbi:heat shock 70 kDa protein 12A isoform X3 [Dasypus novemcinctus]|uniref:heat shock 70 kDa protein 12A isoform X3 n=1 Tax=Dasypus novemcinctus TaxID=9361 RepID=UPI00265FD13C|nr:heat shock 70 kDa protein 12A isoform X3 [Dasypus novemcinctus]